MSDYSLSYYACPKCGCSLRGYSELLPEECPECGVAFKTPKVEKSSWAWYGVGFVVLLGVLLWYRHSNVIEGCKKRCDVSASSCDALSTTVFQQIACLEQARSCVERCDR